jgi:hypothetical protein
MLQRFENWRTSTGDDEQSGWNSSSRSKPLIAQVKNIICGNCQLTVSEEVGISTVLCHTVLTEDLGMHQFSAKSEQSPLTDYLLQRANDSDNLWKSHYQWQDMGLSLWRWNQTTVLILDESFMRVKTILLVFSVIEAMWAMNSLLKVRQLIKTFIWQFWDVWDVIWRKWPEMWTVGCLFLHLCNAPAHTALSIRQFLPSTTPIFTWPLPSRLFPIP